MNFKSTSQKLSRVLLAVSLGMVVSQESTQASTVKQIENIEVAKPTLLYDSQEEGIILAEGSSKIRISSQESIDIVNQENSSSININIDSSSPLKTESISIPVKVENSNNKILNNSVNIPVVPVVTEKVMVQQTESNPVVTLDNIESSDLINNNSSQDNDILLSQQVRVINLSSTKARSIKSPTDKSSTEELLSSVPIQIEYYDPTTSPSVEEMISPNLPKINSPEPYLPSEYNSFKGYIWPAKGVFTSGYGWRWGRMHKGIDIAAPIGTPIIAAADGKVINAGWNSGGYGNLVKIQHFDGSITFYAHNSKIMVRRGQLVKQGQPIAKMGSTGFSTGPHLHFEIHSKGKKAINPVALLPKKRK